MVIGIYGASGFGREVMPIARTLHNRSGHQLVFIDDASDVSRIGEETVVSFEEFCALDGEKSAVIAIGDPGVRRMLATRLADTGIAFSTLQASSSLEGDRCEIGEGAILCGQTQLTSDLKIGRHFHCNIMSYVAHDCEIGDFVTFAPAVCCNGNVVIEDDVYVGTGAILRQGTPDKKLRIGKGAVVGAGAVVLKDVPAGATVIGSPAKPMER